MRNLRWLFALLLLAPGCGRGDDLSRASVGAVRNGRLVQVGNDYLLLESRHRDGATYQVRDAPKRTWRPLRLPDLPGCAQTTYGMGFTMAPYELGLRRECHRPDGTRDLDLIGYELRFRTVRVVLAEPPPDADGYLRYDRDVIAWFSDRDCTWLKRYQPGKREPRPLGLTLKEDGWPLDAAPATPGDCRDHGMVLLPAAGYGLSLGIVASPGARGRTGAQRWKAGFSLYEFYKDGLYKIDDLKGRPRALAWRDKEVVSVDGSRGGVYVVGPMRRLQRLVGWVASSAAVLGNTVYLVEDTGNDTDPVWVVSLPVE